MKVQFFIRILTILAYIVGSSAVVMLLWNIAVPSIFGLTTINFWQALVIYLLARILFSGKFRGGERRCKKGVDEDKRSQ
jgi:hypothetical protein